MRDICDIKDPEDAQRQRALYHINPDFRGI